VNVLAKNVIVLATVTKKEKVPNPPI